jgi:hypothetical protein
MARFEITDPTASRLRTMILAMTILGRETRMHMTGSETQLRANQSGCRPDLSNPERSEMETLGHGMIPDLHVRDVLAKLSARLRMSGAVLVRSIDSIRGTEGLGSALRLHNVAYQVAHGNVCLEAGDLENWLSVNIFTGFDELWFFRKEIPARSLLDLPAATSDSVDFSEGVPRPFVDALRRTGCFLVLGDGCGLNYLTTDDEASREIQGMG